MATALSLGRAAARTTRRRLPVTATLTVAVLVLGAASGALWTPLAGEPLADAVGYGPASVHTGHWWGLVTGAFFADHPVAYVALLLGVVLAGGFAEWRLGTGRALVAGLVVHLVAVGGAMALVLGAAGHGWDWPTGLTHHSDLGMTTALLGAAAAASATLSPGWRLRLRALLVGYAALALVVAGGLADLERLLGIAAGLALGPMVASAARRRGRARHADRRLVVALALLVVALVTLPHAVDLPWPLDRRALGWPPAGPAVLADIVLLLAAVVLVAWPGRHRVHRTPSPEPHAERQLARDRLRAVGSTNRLAWMTTWPQNRWFHSTTAPGYLAHRVHAGVAIGLCDPVAVDEPGRGLLLHEFATRAHRRGLVPCVFAATAETAATAVAMGWRVLPVGEEAVVDLPGLAFQGRAWQDVRTALNHAARSGITVETGRLDELPDAVRLQVAEISCGWTTGRRLPEPGFTLGGLDEAADPEVVVSVAIDPAGVVHGVTSWLPSHRPSDGTVEGWTLDVMRRREGREAFRPVMELLIATSLLRFRDQGCAWASLSASPLAATGPAADASGRSAGLELMVQRVATRLEPFYGFRSLHAFKAKFSPRFEPLYLVYPDDVALPRITVALARAYLPEARLRDLAALWPDRHTAERPARGQASTARVTSALSTAAASSAPSTET